MNNINIFKSLQTSTSFASISITDVLMAIKTGSFTLKSSTINTGALEASTEDKYSTDKFIGDKNKYNHLKLNSVMTWTPNASFNNSHRHSSAVDALTGYIYCDIDGVDPVTIKSKVSKLPFVHAAWSSLSGTGIGFLVKADWTIDNFKSNYTALSKFFKTVYNLDLDKTSDITRTNVFSYDPAVYINESASNIDSNVLLPFIGTLSNPYAKSASKAVKLTHEVQTNFEELVESLNFTVDYKTKVQIAIKHATKTMGQYAIGNKHNFRTSFIGTCTTMNIPFDIMMEEFEAYADEICEDVNYEAMEAMYAAFEGQGSDLYSNLAKFATSSITPTRTITVEKYLDNQLPTSFTKNTTLVAPTGAGKSTYVMEVLQGKRIIITPNTAVLRSFKSFKGVSVFYGDEKSSKFTDIILTTQDSFSNLVNTLEEQGQNLVEYLVIIDEFHTLVTSANYGYKYKAINSVIEVLSNYPVTILGLTATPITTTTNPFYTSFETILVKQKNDVKREIQLAQYDDYRSFCIEKALENYGSKVTTVIYKNDKRNIEVLAEALKMQGLTVAIINSDTKESADYNQIVEQGILTQDVILTTCLLKEGVSIKGKDGRTDVDYIVTGENHYNDLNQLSSRVRNATTITITLASSKESYKNYSLPFFFDVVNADIDNCNTFLLNRLNTLEHTEAEVKLDQRLLGCAVKYNELTYRYEVDNVYKDYLIYEAETKVCTINPLYTIANLLNDVRFDVFPSILEYTEDNKDSIEAAKVVVAKAEKDEKLDFKAVIDACNVSKDVLEKLDYIKDNGTKQEQSLSYYTKFVYARMKKQNLYAAIDMAYDFMDSNRKFNDFKVQLELTELFSSPKTGNGISASFFSTIKKKVKLNVEYTSEQIHKIFVDAAHKTDAKEYLKITKTKATQLFNLMGKSQNKTTKDKNRKSVRTYTLSSFGLDNYNYTAFYSDQKEHTVLVKLKNPYIGL